MTSGMSPAFTWKRSSRSCTLGSLSRSIVVYGCPFRVRNSRMRNVPEQCVEPSTTTSPSSCEMSWSRRRTNVRRKMSPSSTSVCNSGRRCSRSTSMISPSSVARINTKPRRPVRRFASPLKVPGWYSASTCEEVSESCSSCSAPEITTNNRGGSRRGSSNTSPACTLRRRPIASRRAICAAVNLGESFGPSKSRSAGLAVAVGPLGLASTGTVVTYGYLATRVARALRQMGESPHYGSFLAPHRA